jgi:hypothetical protein
MEVDFFRWMIFHPRIHVMQWVGSRFLVAHQNLAKNVFHKVKQVYAKAPPIISLNP